jgi:uncharacterized protein YfaS (alpha-2-macroglobulin family)
MTTTLWLVVLVAAAVIEAGLIHWLVVEDVAPRIDDWLRRREVVRRSVADQEMQAMRAAQQLSLLAWKARHEMYDLGNREDDWRPTQRR